LELPGRKDKKMDKMMNKKKHFGGKFCQAAAKFKCLSAEGDAKDSCHTDMLKKCKTMTQNPCVRKLAHKCHESETPKKCFWGHVKSCVQKRSHKKDNLFIV
jgi:hypothetical protein